MDLIHAIFLGIVQGITEFLPISSSAHLILTSKLLNWPDQGLAFDLAVHFGSLIAVMIYFKEQLMLIVKGKFDFLKRKQTKESDLFKKIVIATIPVIISGLLLQDLIENSLRDAMFVIAITSIFWGILLYFADKAPSKINKIEQIDYKTAFLMGLGQAFAVIPGTSRSGSTMTIARFLKFSRTSAAEFSMLMSIPVIILMVIYKTLSIIINNQSLEVSYSYLIIGTITSFIFALLSIHALMKLVNKVSFLPFVIYRVLLGCLIFYIVL